MLCDSLLFFFPLNLSMMYSMSHIPPSVSHLIPPSFCTSVYLLMLLMTWDNIQGKRSWRVPLCQFSIKPSFTYPNISTGRMSFCSGNIKKQYLQDVAGISVERWLIAWRLTAVASSFAELIRKPALPARSVREVQSVVLSWRGSGSRAQCEGSAPTSPTLRLMLCHIKNPLCCLAPLDRLSKICQNSGSASPFLIAVDECHSGHGLTASC